ncbi:ArsR/SmtB family transcription factor [Actinomadura luteofluorescens]|uniref:DNA-binding transcriptional ArsR family regulator n=1 Tax=Actinomadura luteofluorescens TaxID=46163 RepID=A0A7Y9JDB9_9ACTN|nr:metalloregulator ArsR/SmtB family transcription factor [Actinomadura luteofluorescens]NYD44740.1 DNA-binding transcriptional ArsR family regulator [Actinomadura luteofluorescens]
MEEQAAMAEPVTSQSMSLEGPVGGAATRSPGGGCDGTPAAPLGAGAHEFLKALASEQRQQMLELFAGGIELSVGAVAERLGVGQSNASQQLALLRRGGLLTSRRDGKQVLYRIDSAAIDRSLTELRDYLNTCCPPAD